MRNPLYFFRYLTEKLKLTHFEEFSNIIANEIVRTGNSIRVLDLGAGSAHYWLKAPLYQYIESEKVVVTVIDANTELLESKQSNQIHYINGLIPEVLREIGENQFDWVCAFDLIEHLTKDDGYKLLYEIDRIAQYGSMIFTPNGFVWQPGATNNPFNAHISGWHPKELKSLSWNKQRGYVGLRKFHGPYGLRKYTGKSHLILEGLALFQILVYFTPGLSFAFTAVKRGKGQRMEKQTF